jgi:ankyrin repeat protein
MNILRLLLFCTSSAYPMSSAFVEMMPLVRIPTIFRLSSPSPPLSLDTTALHQAAATNNCREIVRLIAIGHDLEVLDSHYYTPLFIACRHGHIDAVMRLLQARAKINANGAPLGNTALHQVAQDGFHKLADILINAGADVNAVNAEGRTPAMLAVEYGRAYTLGRLLVHKASTKLKDPQGRTIFDLMDVYVREHPDCDSGRDLIRVKEVYIKVAQQFPGEAP